jgi:hypothetical protein
MAKGSKKNSMKLPKRLLGVKLPKKSRKSLNRILKGASSDVAHPLVAAAVGSFATLLAERLEKPLSALLAAAEATETPGPTPSAAKH